MTSHPNDQPSPAPTGMRKLLIYLLPPVLILLLSVTAAAQTDISSNPPVPSPATGIYGVGANALGGIESVNTVNGNVTLTFPLAQLPHDNVSLGAGVSLIYNSAVYDAPAVPTSTSQANLSYTASAHGGDWNYGYEYKLWAQPRIPLVDMSIPLVGMSGMVCDLLSTAEKTYWYKNFLQTPDGSNHILYRVDAIPTTNGPTDEPSPNATGFLSTDFAGFGNPNTSPSLHCNIPQQLYTGTLVFATVDGSDIRVETTTAPGGQGSWIAYLPDGGQVRGDIITGLGNGAYYGEDSPSSTTIDGNGQPIPAITDRNGNGLFISGNCVDGAACQETISDAPGRTITVSFASSGSRSNNWTDTITWNGPNGSLSAYVNSSLTPMNGISYECGSTTSGFDGHTYCPLNTSLWQVQSIQMAPAATNGNQTTFAFGYTPALGNQNWGEVHTVQKCVGVQLTTCSQPQWTVKYDYRFDPASPIRPPGVTINPIASRSLTYAETLDTVGATPLAENTYYSIWYPTNSVYTLYGGESISPPNTITNPDNGITTLYLSSLCATSTVARDTCSPVVYKAVHPDNSITETSRGWWTADPAPPAGIPSGTLLNLFPAITAETRPTGVARASQSNPDVNGNITSVTRYDWGTSISRNANGLVTSISGTALQNNVISYNEQSTGAVYWTPHYTGTQPNLRALTSVSLNGTPLASYTYDNATTTANLTQAQLWDSGQGQGVWISEYRSYNPNGNIASTTDANNNISAICYDSNNLYPTTTVVAATAYSCPNPTERSEGRKSTYTSEFFSGVALSATDADNNVTTIYTYDNLGRQVTATQSGGGLQRTTSTTYDDANLMITTVQSDTTTSTLTNTTYYDPLGRVTLTVDGDGNRVASAYRYGSNYRFQLQSTAYTTGSTPAGWTLTKMDTVGRVVEVDHYSGSAPPSPWGSNDSKTGTVTYGYDQTLSTCTGPATSETDEAGNTKYTCSDGMDRLVSVTEPDPSSGAPGTLTTYGYDSLNNLISVDSTGQPTLSCGHIRCFTYSTLSRLLSASNPESGTTTYTYDNNGNLLTRTDANGSQMTVEAYDGLNRPVGTNNNTGPAICYTIAAPAVSTAPVFYTYDSTGFKGALSSVSASASSACASSSSLLSTTSYSYDGFGRISGSAQTIGSNAPYTFTYGYSLTDQLTSMTYPSGRRVSYALDAADRVTAVQNVTAGSNYASSIGYTADGGIQSMTLGQGVTQTISWNDRLQATGLTVMPQSGPALLSLGFYPCPGGGTSCSSGNNGNLQVQAISMPGLSLTQTYSYDHLNRLTNAAESGGGGNWSQGYVYDALGNRAVPPASNTGSPALFLSPETPADLSAYSTTVPNRFAPSTGWTYDYNGNVTQVAGMARTFTYDAENRQATANLNGAVSTYTYDGMGQRVAKTTANGQTTFYAYDAFGNLAAEYTSQTQVNPCGAATCYAALDHLGSTRMITDGVGSTSSVVRYDYQPFGVELSAGTNGRSTALGYLGSPDSFLVKYTGQARDQETSTQGTSVDWFQVRYMSGGAGRFQSPDPGNAGADPANPQTWNGYGYVENNPLTFTDPNGLGFWSDILGAAGFASKIAGDILTLGFGGYLQGAIEAGSQIGTSAASAVWSEQAPVGIGSGAGIDTGAVFGEGNTSPFVFSAMAPGGSGTTGGFPTDLSDLEYWWQIERHHLLPQAEEFRKFFNAAGLDIEEYTVDIPRWIHRLRPFGVHTGEENWNVAWRSFFNRFPNANARQILRYKDQMIKRFGLAQYVTRPSVLLTIDPGMIPSVANIKRCGRYICTGSGGLEVF